ncbi:MAG: TonB family protein [Bacteroidales bacterium]|nr:TonB family protein [Bacteroidales bacterium]
MLTLESLPIVTDSIFEYEEDTLNGETFFYCVEIMPQFRNGDRDVIKFILENTEYPETAIEDSVEGRVFLHFTINEDGSVSNVELARGIRYDLDEECISVIESMPNWKPGKQRGEFVKVRYTIPFNFKLNVDSETKIAITPKTKNEDFKIEFKVYPNPASEFVNIEILNNNNELEYQLINQNGQLLQNGLLENNTTQLNISELKIGFYLIRLISKENGVVETKKLIKK